MANYQELFYTHFITAMIRLGITWVKTGNEGEIRQDCGSFNNNSVYSIAKFQQADHVWVCSLTLALNPIT
ncbi:hypothetical protein NC653_013381 [Populus alba x Populus x berolinensis]|uniref:Plant heme peroxidase family profile domain-containing protein n=1 Tax=Populus alba x Populus x berolinensis TaxID=444605 RepID=A0AAD6W2Y4_9ROSI|nr:hypothetical protein NC653_013381 [Populus alba x Populus x berolinensis]